ncbi:citrate lyase acyl carrier protein [Nguyenibacter vanlangensis]|uniref:Citrate lyase acyl carrier protein n=1 Tax=Nguyenibacter vanlangensis TaxID=1216886 RepID=A0ABZ3D0B5_9PROT
MKIVKPAVAGTLESSDLLVKVSPGDGSVIDIVIRSAVEKRFGKQIRETVSKTLETFLVSSVSIEIEDKGALDCVIKARVQAAILRGAEAPEVPMEKLS